MLSDLMAIDPLSLRFEKILERAFSRGLHDLHVVGTDSPLALALFLTQSTSPQVWEQPNVVLVPSDKAASQLESDLRFFDPEIQISVLPGFDVSPYSGLYPNARNISARVRWASGAQNPSSRHVFIASAEAILQRTIPPTVLHQHTLKLKLGSDLPAEFAKQMSRLGYQATPIVEDEGSFAIRGGIIDIYSPAHSFPVRLELFGDSIESMRFFNPDTQRSEASTERFTILPPREIIYDDDVRQRAAQRFVQNAAGRAIDPSDKDSILQGLIQGQIFPGLDFLIGDFYEEFALPLDHFQSPITLWQVGPIDLEQESDQLFETLKREESDAKEQAILPKVSDLFVPLEKLPLEIAERRLSLSKIEIQNSPLNQAEDASSNRIPVSTSDVHFLPQAMGEGGADTLPDSIKKIQAWREEGLRIFIASNTLAQAQRLHAFLEKFEMRAQIVADDDYSWDSWSAAQSADSSLLHIIPRAIDESLRLADEEMVFLRDEDFFGRKKRRREYKTTGTLAERTNTLTFADLKVGDNIVHVLHGVGIYEGLKVMSIQGVDSEFIQLSYKEGDKLYLPIYRVGQVQKYAGAGATQVLDRLGGAQWQKTKTKVRRHLRELAVELIELYAKRAQVTRPPFPPNDDDFERFEAAFPYDETDDQLKAVRDIISDLSSERPMDRLVCGDVGFGKTEVAMRATFKAIQAGKQIAVLAPTTILTFQHLETFQKRLKGWPLNIRALNRFVTPAESKKTIAEAKEGKVDILIGTHRLLSKDIGFKDLGLLIIDEEQKFGVTHKEKIKRLKTSVDTLTLSATPIPRTLNMSLIGMRDLSIINTPPVDRLPTRTFVCKFDEETIRKAILSEIQRGGQIFFLHNRVQSIYGLADELRRIVPEARLRVGHGQMEEHELESTMVAFFNHDIDVLLCTTIIESGIDNPRANTMFIDNAQTFGLSQLYQLRGRVGRSKERAYCYLLIPPNKRLESDAQERLKVIQENTALGSGIRIAHHDLELRGAGNLLGESQSGHIDSVGYEMYLELLEEAIRTAKGEEVHEEVEPEINVRIPALIPDSYIGDIRIRLSYYKALAEIASPEDIDRIEDELRDQFGKLPEQVVNLMGLMLIRHHCKELGVRDLSSGTKTVSLSFTEHTPLPPNKVVELATRDNKKYSITPDNRLIVRMNTISWPNIYEELQYLKRLC